MNNNYKEWIKTVSDSPSIVGVLGEESLYPIWKLVGCMADNDSSISPEVANARMKELEDAFNAYGLENYNKLIADEIESDENKKQVEELEKYIDTNIHFFAKTTQSQTKKSEFQLPIRVNCLRRILAKTSCLIQVSFFP